MKIFIAFLSFIISLSVIFYPTNTNSNTTGSPGGKTGSPLDGQTCIQCHGGNIISNVNNTALITSNIPNSGYVIGNTYTVTLTANGGTSVSKYGFELTAENPFGKSGEFFITDNNNTKFININNPTAVTHTASGTNGGPVKQWSFDWTPTINSQDTTIFYASVMLTNNNSNNSGDEVYTTNLPVFEQQITSISEIINNEFIFNNVHKTITSNQPIKIYDLTGKIVLENNAKLTDISNLNSGIYIIKSVNKSQKITL